MPACARREIVAKDQIGPPRRITARPAAFAERSSAAKIRSREETSSTAKNG